MRLDFPVIILAILLVQGTLHAGQAGMLPSSIVVKSPFLPPDFNPPGETGIEVQTPVSSSRFEFRGVYQLNGQYYFHLYDQSSRKGSWVGKTSTRSGFPEVIQYTPSHNQLVIDMGGERLVLEMKQADNQSTALADNGPVTNGYENPGKYEVSPANDTISRRPVIRPAQAPSIPPATRRLTLSPRINNN